MTLAIIILVIFALMLGVSVRLTYVSLMWKKIYKQQAQVIKTQGEIIDNQNATIKSYKKMMANGICFIPAEQKN